jgi:hypothetical protein
MVFSTVVVLAVRADNLEDLHTVFSTIDFSFSFISPVGSSRSMKSSIPTSAFKYDSRLIIQVAVGTVLDRSLFWFVPIKLVTKALSRSVLDYHGGGVLEILLVDFYTNDGDIVLSLIHNVRFDFRIQAEAIGFPVLDIRTNAANVDDIR